MFDSPTLVTYSTDAKSAFHLADKRGCVHTNGSKLPERNWKVGSRDEYKNAEVRSADVSSDVNMRLSKRKKRKSQKGLVEEGDSDSHTSINRLVATQKWHKDT